MKHEDLDNIFTYHAPFGDQTARYQEIRAKAKELASMILTFCPPSREQSLAVTSVQQSVMWANAAIAIHEKLEE